MIRRPAPKTALALGAAFVGGLGIVSALTPELADRSDIVRGVLPPGMPEAARVLALAFGIALVWLARGLAQGKRRAWLLAVWLVVASAVAHLAKGLDFEESTVSILLLAALWRWRAAFSAPGDPALLRPLLRALIALCAIGAFAGLREIDTMHLSQEIESALVLLAVPVAFRALYLWLRPLAARLQSPAEAKAAAEVVRRSGRDSLCYFSLRRDKSLLFSPSRRSFLAYRVVGGTALVSGDPIGDPAELPELLAELRRIAAARAWRVALAGVSEETLPLARAARMKPIYLGDEALVRPETFSLEGRSIRKVRQSVTRLRRGGYTVRILPVGDVDGRLRAEIAEVSAEWRGRWPERGFTMAMDALWSYPDGLVAVAEGPDGLGGFVQLVPSPASGGWSLATMRRRHDTPNGLMEYLIVETIEWARSYGVREVSLNFSVFAEALRVRGGAPRRRRLARFLLLRCDRVFQLERLFSFNRKFQPEWRRRYVCVERYTDAPFVALAYLQAEQLLTPPRPWIRESDLAAR